MTGKQAYDILYDFLQEEAERQDLWNQVSNLKEEDAQMLATAIRLNADNTDRGRVIETIAHDMEGILNEEEGFVPWSHKYRNVVLQ